MVVDLGESAVSLLLGGINFEAFWRGDAAGGASEASIGSMDCVEEEGSLGVPGFKVAVAEAVLIVVEFGLNCVAAAEAAALGAAALGAGTDCVVVEGSEFRARGLAQVLGNQPRWPWGFKPSHQPESSFKRTLRMSPSWKFRVLGVPKP